MKISGLPRLPTTSTRCLAWHLIRKDGVKLGFTDHDKALMVDGVNCEPETGFTASVAEAALGLSGDISQVEGVLSSTAISAEDIERGRYDDAQIIQYSVDWTAPFQAQKVRRFHVGEISIQDEVFNVELRSFSAKLEKVRGRFYRRGCDADLGDERCKINLSVPIWSRHGTVVEPISQSGLKIAIQFQEEIDHELFERGQIEFNSGVLSGQSYSIASIEAMPDNVTLGFFPSEPLAQLPGLSDAVVVTAGCDKQFATCKNRFNNHLNFRGFPHIPSNDKALAYADSETRFDGAPLVD